MKYVICDIDGCILDCEHRLSHIFAGDPLTGIEADTVIQAGLVVYRALAARPYITMVFLTSRPEKARQATTAQLKSLFPNTQFHLWMRPDGDRTPDHQFKIDALVKHGVEPAQVLVAFDDRPGICRAYREHGITAYQTATGY